MPQRRLTEYWLISDPITSADANSTKAVLEIPAETFVSEVVLIVSTVFAGGTPSIDIGDGDNDDGWIDTVDITETTAGSYRGDETTTAAYSQTGRYYATADTIDAVIATGLTSGSAIVMARCVDLSNTL